MRLRIVVVPFIGIGRFDRELAYTRAFEHVDRELQALKVRKQQQQRNMEVQVVGLQVQGQGEGKEGGGKCTRRVRVSSVP